MISLPRSCSAKPVDAASIAASGAAAAAFFPTVTRTSGVSNEKCAQSIGEASKSDRPRRRTGICCALIASSACAFHLSVVETMIRSAKPSLPDAEKNGSMSCF